jgi:hypothetical protein
MPAPKQESEKESNSKQESKQTRSRQEYKSTYSLIGAAVAGFAEVAAFQPVDTGIKRLQNSKQEFKSIKDRFTTAVMDSKSNRISLYPGIGWGLVYKVLQRTYKFGGQPFVEKELKPYFGTEINNKRWLKFLSGAIMGAGEAALVPIDTLKIRKQTGSADHGVSYRAFGTTIMRNVIGSSALFGTPFLIESFFAGQEKSRIQATFMDSAGAITSLILSHPLDVIKTRMQADEKAGGFWKVTLDIATTPKQFARGLGVKLLSQSPKLMFFMFVQREVINYLEKQEVADSPRMKSRPS